MLERLLERLEGTEVELGLPSGTFHGTLVSLLGGYVRFVETALPTYGNAELMLINTSEIQYIRVIQN